MGEYSGRKGIDRLVVPKRVSRPISRDFKDQNAQLCNRIGCSGRLSPARRSTQDVNLDKTRVLRSSSRCSAHGKEIAGISSKGVPKVTNPVKPPRPLPNKSNSLSEKNSSASSGSTSNDLQEAEVADSNSLSEGTDRPVNLEQKDFQSGESKSTEIGSPSAVSNGRPKRSFLKKSAIGADTNLSNPAGSGTSRSSPQLFRQNASATRPGSRYLKCSSAPNVDPLESASSNGKQILKRISDGESSSSSRVKQPTHTRAVGYRSGTSISETRQAPSAQTNFKDNVRTSVRAHRSDTSSVHRPPQNPRRELPTDQRRHRLPTSLSVTSYPHRAHNFTRPSTTASTRSRNLLSPSEISRTSNLVDREGFRHYNISGIAEMLLALDRIENDEEMSFEQLLALETNLFLGGLSFHDQHRDMRLDIDHMSYEELLALEERMGSVSTALSEETLAKCIKMCVFKSRSSVAGFSDMDGCEDDTKCSICQEEYANGDEMGELHCKHSYHIDCIDQWLRQKNWCPICKSSAASSTQ